MYIHTCLSSLLCSCFYDVQEGGGIFLRCCKILFATARRCVNVDRDGVAGGERNKKMDEQKWTPDEQIAESSPALSATKGSVMLQVQL
ncbi:hypothetical protein OIU77_026867 [Salix suchowensis]|uniref:Uncharacterized protein n=1 Tax=Salix suchowensis TaxID=1278906 RepID=A0ABQ9BPC8_9ROSI|nr:hypothetical protein OIU77_026867 [Salix suchowensis]